MREHEDRRVERRLVAPPAFPLGILVPPRISVLAGAHDLGANADVVESHEGIVDATAATGLADQLVPPAGREHPFMESLAGVAERRLATQANARAEAIQRDGEELDS